MARSKRPLEARFWEKVRKTDGCWEWAAGCSAAGYGVLGACGRRMFYAHRLSWEIHYGPIPRGMHVLHRCDNPPCTNPTHLFIGTHTDNVRDMWEKGRGRIFAMRGEANGNAKLTAEGVKAIRSGDHAGLTQKEIGALYGVSADTVSSVVTRQTWRHVP